MASSGSRSALSGEGNFDFQEIASFLPLLETRQPGQVRPRPVLVVADVTVSFVLDCGSALFLLPSASHDTQLVRSMYVHRRCVYLCTKLGSVQVLLDRVKI